MSDMLLKLTITADGRAAVSVVDQVTDATKRLDSVQKSGASANAAAKTAADQYTVALRNELTQVNASIAAANRWEAAQAGATKAQLKQIDAVTAAAQAQSRAVDTQAASLLRYGAALGIAMSTKDIIDSIDAWGQYSSRIGNATLSAEEHTEAQQRLMDVSNRAYKSYGNSVEIFTRAIDPMREMGFATDDALRVVEALQLGLVTSSASAEKSTQVINAFSNALITGKMNTDQFNSVIAGAPTLQKAMADGLGVSIQQLQRMAAEGKLTTDVLVRAFGTEVVEAMKAAADAMPVTTADAIVRFRNQFTQFFGEAEAGNVAVQGLVKSIGFLGDNLNVLVPAAAAYAGVRLAAHLTATARAFYETNIASARAVIQEKAAALAHLETMRAQYAQAVSANALMGSTNSLTAAKAALTAAEARHAAATSAAAAATTLASRALTLVGGPLGLVSLAVGVGVAAWQKWGSSADTAAQSALDLAQPVDDLVKKFQDLDRTQQSIELRGVRQALDDAKKDAQAALKELQSIAEGMSGAFSQAGPSGARLEAFTRFREELERLGDTKLDNLGELDRQVNAAVQELLRGASLPTAMAGEVETLAAAWIKGSRDAADLTAKLQGLQGAMLGVAGQTAATANAQKKAYDDLIKKYATGPEKLAAAIEEAKTATGDNWNKALENRIRASFAGTKQATSDGLKSLQDLERAHAEQRASAMQIGLAQGLSLLKANHAQGLISTRDYHQAVLALELAYLDAEKSQAQQEHDAAVARAKGKREAVETEAVKLQTRLGKIEEEKRKKVEATNDAIVKSDEEANKKRADALLEYEHAMQALIQTGEDALNYWDDQANALEFELSLLGKSAEEQALLRDLRNVELTQRRQIIAAVEAYNRLVALDPHSPEHLANATAQLNKQLGIIKDSADVQRQRIKNGHDEQNAQAVITAELAAQQQLASEFFDAMRGGWQGIKDFAKRIFWDWLKTQFMQRFTLNLAVSGTGGGDLVRALASTLGLGGGSSAGGGGILGSLLNIGGSGGLSSLLGTMPAFGGELGAAGTGLAGMLATSGFEGLASVAASIGTYLPYIGIAFTAFKFLKGLFKNKDGAWFDFGNTGDTAAERAARKNPSNSWTDSFGTTIALQGEGKMSDMPGFVEAWTSMTENWIKAFGEDLAAQIPALVSDWTGFSQRGRGTEWENGEQYAAALQQESKDVMAEYFSRVFSVVDQDIADQISNWSGTVEELANFINGVIGVQMAINQQAVLLESIIGQSIQLSDLTALQAEGEALTDTFSRIVGVFGATNLIAQTLGHDAATAFGAVGLASLDARQRLIDYAGGLQQLSSEFDFYLQNFFSEEERRAMAMDAAQQQLAAGFQQLGLAVPQTREEFRALVSSLDLSTDEGAKLYAALMKLAPAMAAVTDEAASAATELLGYSQDYLDGFFTEAERQAMRLADASAEVARVFADLGVAVPQSREAFRALVDSIDTSTEAGVIMRNALMNVAGAFATATAGAKEAQKAVAGIFTSGGVNDTVSMQAKLVEAARKPYALIEEASHGALDTLSRKMAAAQAAAARLNDQYNAEMIRTGYNGTVQTEAYRQARDEMLKDQQEWARQLALLASLAAQYGSEYADELLEVELWREQQRKAASGNAQLLLYIEEEYQRRRNQIISGGVADGLSTLQRTIQDWLNGLLLNEQLTTLMPEERLAEARRQYEQALQSGDSSKMTQAADAYLAEARNMYASSQGYQDIFNAVIAQMSAIAQGYSVPVVTAPGATVSGTVPAVSTPAGAESPAVQAAIAQATATSQAALQSSEEVKQLLGQIILSVDREGAASRNNATQNANRIVDAVEDASWDRAPV